MKYVVWNNLICKCSRQIDPSASCSVTSAQIEQCYNRNQRGVMEFYTAKYTYRLDFSGEALLVFIPQHPLNECITINEFPWFPLSYVSPVMRQINVTTGKQRPIKRSLQCATGFRFEFVMFVFFNLCSWKHINCFKKKSKAQIFIVFLFRELFFLLKFCLLGLFVIIWPYPSHVTGRESTQMSLFRCAK